jgi:hypothetical protein
VSICFDPFFVWSWRKYLDGLAEDTDSVASIHEANGEVLGTCEVQYLVIQNPWQIINEKKEKEGSELRILETPGGVLNLVE